MATILAVDDSASMRQMMSVILKGAGHKVIEAVDGEDALAKANDSKPDLVLADVNMPNMDGITLIKKLRRLQGLEHIPMLLLTTEFTTDKKAEGKDAGATGWLVKPFDPDKLLASINKFFN